MTEKPIKATCGGFETDSNFDTELFSKSQAIKRARARLKRNRPHGCKKFELIDKGAYWAISVY